VRQELESLAARLAIPGLTDADLEELTRLIAEMRAAADAGDGHTEAIADAAFHGRIVELSGNATLRRVWRTLEPYSRTYITIAAPGADRRAIADHHVPILDALRKRDPDLVREVLRRHFEDAAAVARAAAALPSDGEVPPIAPVRPRRTSRSRRRRTLPAPALAGPTT
jgi:DNA-binding GntR family transcriptional regulator